MNPRLKTRLENFHFILKAPNKISPVAERNSIQRRASSTLGIVRNIPVIDNAINENEEMIQIHLEGGIEDRSSLLAFLKNEDLLITERAFLESAKSLLSGLNGGRGPFLTGNQEELYNETEEGICTSLKSN